jgi:hypothetical protein
MKRHAASGARWLQWALAASVVVAIGSLAFHALTGRAADTRYITLGELRSRAAELEEIARNAAAERLTATYVRAQCAQLAPRIATLRDDLVQAEDRDASADAGRARHLAEQLLESTHTLAEQGESVTVAAALQTVFAGIVAALIPLEQQARGRRASVATLTR